MINRTGETISTENNGKTLLDLGTASDHTDGG